MGRPLKFDEGFRKTALERLQGCEYIAGLAQQLGISRSQLYRIQRDALGRKPEPKPEAWLREKAEERQRRRIADLERLVARQALEPDFFRGALLRIGENRRKQGQHSGKPSTSQSGTWTGGKAN
jgi:AraC-like DNA-binding protein